MMVSCGAHTLPVDSHHSAALLRISQGKTDHRPPSALEEQFVDRQANKRNKKVAVEYVRTLRRSDMPFAQFYRLRS